MLSSKKCVVTDFKVCDYGLCVCFMYSENILYCVILTQEYKVRCYINLSYHILCCLSSALWYYYEIYVNNRL